MRSPSRPSDWLGNSTPWISTIVISAARRGGIPQACCTGSDAFRATPTIRRRWDRQSGDSAPMTGEAMQRRSGSQASAPLSHLPCDGSLSSCRRQFPRSTIPISPLTQRIPGLGGEWAPRAGFARGTAERRWPVVRLGYGMYFSRTRNSEFRNGEVHQAEVSVQEFLPGHVQVEAGAIGNLGRRLPVTFDANIDPTANPKTGA